MAITINGSGTIGGVSVGGLPDGIVDTDMLASNAVTTAKITDGNVTSAKVGSLSDSNLPAGSVLQVKYSQIADITFSNSLTNNSYIHTGLSITPSSTSSKIVAICSFGTEKNYGGGGVMSGTGYWYADIYMNTTKLSRFGNAIGHYSPSLSRQHLAGSIWHTPGTTSAVTYSIQAYDCSSTHLYTVYIYNPTILLMEIAG